MFTDPITLTLSGVSQSLPRISNDKTSATYQKSDSNLALIISHQDASQQRVRTMVKLMQRFIVPDPLTAVNDYETLGIHLVIDRPEAGLSSAQIDAAVQSLKAFLTTGNVEKMIGREI